jgi:asparagine synthase (glutamine-hydrolysing)
LTRWLAGTFDPSGRTESSRLRDALRPEAGTLAAVGALHVAYSGPTRGAQDVLCLLDGYVDNAAELSDDLGISPTPSCEDLLAVGWRRWGVDLLPRVRGEFALVIWDAEAEEGLLARDQLGVRSMFLHERAGVLHFAGEIRHLLALLPGRPAPDRASVAHWLAMSNRPGSATLFAGVRRLNPGAILLLNRRGTREEHYWTPRFTEPLHDSEPELAHQMRAALDVAVERRIAKDGLTGVLMSGGLDSSSIAAVSASKAPGRVLACAAVFPEHPAVDESPLIDELRRTFTLGGITAEVRAGGLLASALESIVAWDLPLRSWGDFWALPLLRAAADAGAQVVLGGDGGDELFGVRAHLLADRLRAGHPVQAFRLAHELPGARDRPPRRELAAILADVALSGALPYGLHERLRRSARGAPDWLRSDALCDLLDTDDPLAWKRLDGPRWWAHAAYGLTRGVEETGVFEHQRRRSASAGLEARHPLFDLDLLQLALRQPPLATFDRYRSRPVLRTAMADLLPDSVRMRPQKALFDSLLLDCMTGTDGATAARMLGDPAAELRAFVDQGTVGRILFDESHMRQAEPFRWMWQIWRLITAECWLRAQAAPQSEIFEDIEASPARVVLRHAPSRAEKPSYVFPP